MSRNIIGLIILAMGLLGDRLAVHFLPWLNIPYDSLTMASAMVGGVFMGMTGFMMFLGSGYPDEGTF